MKYKSSQKGITLVALVITIVILLILAGISISALTNTGLFGKAKEAKQKTENAQAEENAILDEYASKIDEITGGSTITIATIAEVQADAMLRKTENTTAEDAYGNKITIPAGFKVTTDATTVNKGIVIEDTNGNQFVWIPVGTVYTNVEKTESKAIELGRYVFNEDGIPSIYSGSFVEEDSTDTANLKNYGNTIARNINEFKASATTNGGYYIGRYEARTETARSSNSDAITTLTEKGNQYIYNYVTQQQSATLSREMYSSSKFTSDLMNSYAWDTATLFLQECGDNSTYSRQSSLNTSLATTGTNNSDIKDIQCNVYDMASNTSEWTTETYIGSSDSCVHRGGIYSISDYYNSRRVGINISHSYDDLTFRPIIYLL